MLEIQRLTQSATKGCGNEKKVHLSSVDSGSLFQGKCRNRWKVCGYGEKECKQCAGNLQGGKASDAREGNKEKDCSNKTCNFGGIKGHKESQCFKKIMTKLQHGGKDT